ncbi:MULTISPECIES: amidohydrolase family protein [unclassified Kribbella]|uniref:amidohydrolase family protein n=1 Tax=unclassified Kribbella TaxID=2644121 RepID=UPI003016C5B3
MTQYGGPVIDTHVHLELDDEMRMPGMTSHGVVEYLAAASDVDLKASAVLVMAPKDNPERTRAMNDLALTLGADDARWLPLCSVHPFDGDFAAEEIDRVAEAGARGFKLHPNTQAFDLADPRVTDVVRRIAGHGLPVLFDGYSPFDSDQPGKFVKLSTELPEARIVIAHALGPRFAELLVYDVLARFPGFWTRNIWVDLSFTGGLYADSPYREQFAWSVRRVGVDRLLLGSDYPIDSPGRALATLGALGFTLDEQRAIAHNNAAKLYGLTGE